MSRIAASSLESETEFFDCEGAVAYLHGKGLKHVTKRSVIRATYEGKRLLKNTRIGSRVYWHVSDLEAWIETLREHDSVKPHRSALDDNAMDDPANNWEE